MVWTISNGIQWWIKHVTNSSVITFRRQDLVIDMSKIIYEELWLEVSHPYLKIPSKKEDISIETLHNRISLNYKKSKILLCEAKFHIEWNKPDLQRQIL